MKKILLLLFISVCSTGCFISEDDMLVGYHLQGKKIIFLFDPLQHSALNTDLTIEKISVRGSFTEWKDLTGWEMVLNEDASIWTLEKTIQDVEAPGNCGQPEFKFVVTQNGNDTWLNAHEDIPAGNQFLTNNIILFHGDNPEDIARKEEIALTIKEEYENDADLTNFREVSIGHLGANVLYRSYHPFIQSRPDNPREEDRIAKIQELMELNSINSVISLSGNEGEPSEIPAYYQNIIDNGNVLFYETSYNTVYYRTDQESFWQLMNEVSTFFIAHDKPFLVHCRLGNDRTGVVVATLAGFMGATWGEIASDYERSNNVGMGEYRDRKLLKYAFEEMLQVKIKNNRQRFRTEMLHFMKEKAGLSNEQIIALYVKLQGK